MEGKGKEQGREKKPVRHACNPATPALGRQRQNEFNILDYTLKSRSAWATLDPVRKGGRKEKEVLHFLLEVTIIDKVICALFSH